MAIDWDSVDLDGATKRAATKTDAQLSGEISSVTRMTDAEVKELCPTPADVKQLKKLIDIVNSATTQNEKMNAIMKNTQEFGTLVVKLVEKGVKAIT